MADDTDNLVEPTPTVTAELPLSGKAKRPGRLRRLVVRPLFWFLAGLAICALGLQLLLDSQLLRERMRVFLVAQLSDLLGRPVTIVSLDLDVLPLSLDLRQVTIAGPRPNDPPLFTVERVVILADFSRDEEPTLRVRQLSLLRPRFHLELGPDGANNLPKLAPGTGAAGKRRLRVELGALTIRDGSLELNELTLPLEVDAEGVSARLAGLGGFDLEGSVAVERVMVTLPDARPIALSLAGRAVLADNRLELRAVHLQGPELRARVDGAIALTSPTKVELEVEADSSLALLAELGYVDPAERLAGDVHVGGQVTVSRDAWGFTADVTSPKLDLVGFELAELVGRARGDSFGVNLAIARAGYRGGSVSGTVGVDLRRAMRRDDGLPVAADLTLSGVALDALLADLKVPLTGLDGRIDGQAEYVFGHRRFAFGDGKAQLSLRPSRPVRGVATVEPVSGAKASTLDLAGTAVLTVAGGRLALGTAEAPISLSTPEHAILLSGEVELMGGAGQLDLAVDTSALEQLMILVPGAAADARSGELPTWVPTAGRGKVGLRLGFGRQTTAEVTLDLLDVVTRGARADTLTGRLEIDDAALRGARLELVRPSGALLVDIPWLPFDATEESVDVALDAASWPLDEINAWLPFTLPISGRLTGSVVLTGSLDALSGTVVGEIAELRQVPSDPAAGVDVANRFARTAPRREAVLGDLELDLSFDPATVEVARARLRTPAGNIDLTGKLSPGLAAAPGEDHAPGGGGDNPPSDLGLDLAVAAADLDLARPPFAAWLAGTGLTGHVAATAKVAGSLARPLLELQAKAGELALNGRQLVGGGEIKLALDGDRLVARGTAGGLLELAGTGVARPDRLTLDLELVVPDLPALFVLAGLPLVAESGHARGRLAMSSSAAGMVFGLTLDQLALVEEGIRIENREPISASLADGELMVDSLWLGVSESPSELFVNGSIGLAAPHPLDLRTQGSLDLAEIAGFLPAELVVAGQLDLLSTIRGELAAPAWNGEAVLSRGRLTAAGLPQPVESIEALVLLYPDEFVLDHLGAEFAGGRLNGAGNLRLATQPATAPTAGDAFEQPPAARTIEYAFQLGASDLTLRVPEGWLLHGGAQLGIQQDARGERQIRGTATLDRAYYLRDLPVELSQLLPRLLRRNRVEVAEASEAFANTAVNILVDVRDALRVRNNVADLRGGGELTVTGSLARPVLFGAIELEPGGRLKYADNDYLIERAVLTFANPYRLDPVVDLVATTEVRDYDVTLRLAGTVERLRADLASDPPLPQLELLALVATGQPLGSGGEYLPPEPGSAEASLDAGGILAEQAARLVSDRVGQLFRLDTFRIAPATDAAGGLSAGRITVGKRLSRDVFATYSYDPAASDQQVLEVEWRLGPELSLYLTQNGDGSYAVDARWERAF